MDEPRKYESIKYIVSITGFVLDALILLWLVYSGWSIRIRNFAERTMTSPWGVVLVYVLIVGAIFKVFGLVLDFYSGYIVEHRFGLSRQSLMSWIKDHLKAVAIGAPLGLAAVELIYYLLRTYPDRWWIYASLAFIAFAVIMTNLAPILLLPLFF